MLASSIIGLGVDSSGVIEGVAKAKRSIGALGDSAKKSGKEASDGLRGVGDSGKAAADKVDASTKRMIASIEKQTLSLGKTKSEYYASIAAINGTEKALGPYIQKLAAAERAAKEAGDAQSKLGSAASGIKGHLAALAGVFSVAAVASWGKSLIDADDNLNDLTKSTGLSISSLNGLALAAEQSGGDLEGIASSINKLSVNMGKNADKFAAMGITAKDPLEAFKQLSDVFVSIQDPQDRAAFGAAALGKSWEIAAPLLAEGGKNIGDMVAKGSALSGITEEMAAQADALNDNLAELKVITDGIGQKMAADMLPGLVQVTGAMRDAYIEGGKLKALWVGLGGVGALVFTDRLDSDAVKAEKATQKVIDRLAFLSDKKTELESNRSRYDSSGWMNIFPRRDFEGTISAIQAEIDRLQKSIAKPPAPKQGASSEQDMFSEAQVDAYLKREKQAADLKKRLNEFLRQTNAATAPVMSEYDKVVKALKTDVAGGYAEAEAAANGYNRSQTDFTKLKMGDVWKSFSAGQKEVIAGLFSVRVEQEKTADATLFALQREKKAREDSHRLAKQEADEAGSRDKNINDYMAKLQEEAATINLSSSALQDYRDQQILTNNGMKAGLGDWDAYLKKIKDLREHIKDLNRDWKLGIKDGLQDYLDSAGATAKNMSTLVSGAFSKMDDALTNFVMTGKLNFADLTKSILADMVKIAIQESITKPFAAAAMSFFGSANGNAFSGGSPVTAFAAGGTFTNSIATRPTVAPMALFGEAGPEAIMPLTRLPGGRLGVQAQGGGGGVTNNVNIVINSDGSSEQGGDSNAQAKELGQRLRTMVLDVLYQEQRNGGSLARRG